MPVMRVTRAYKTELDLNDRQVTACKRHAGAARYAYNWGLQRKQEDYRTTGKCPSAIDLHRELNALKQTSVPWMYEVSKCAPQEALRNLDRAFDSFFCRCTLKQEGKWRGKVGYPQRKTKKKGLGSFRLTGSIVILPADRFDCHLARCHSTPPTRPAALERARLPADEWNQGAFRDRFRAGRTLVREHSGGTRTPRSLQHWPCGGC